MRSLTLVFVYNADSGIANTLLDIGHKIVAPQTYPCQLCALTHSLFRMRGQWRAFVERLGHPVEFLHRNELAERYGISDLALPAILKVADGKAHVWIAAEEIRRCQSLEELEGLVEKRLRAPDPQD